MSYATENKVGSPRLHLLNKLRAAGVYSEFPKDGFVKLVEEVGYYFSEEILEKGFDFSKCVRGKTSGEFMEFTGYSRPKINSYIEKHGRVVYLAPGYYDLEAFGKFLETHIQEHVERRGRKPKADSVEDLEPASENVDNDAAIEDEQDGKPETPETAEQFKDPDAVFEEDTD